MGTLSYFDGLVCVIADSRHRRLVTMPADVANQSILFLEKSRVYFYLNTVEHMAVFERTLDLMRKGAGDRRASKIPQNVSFVLATLDDFSELFIFVVV